MKMFDLFDSRFPNFTGSRVYKEDFMKVIGDMKRMLIRAKYHTDQLEGT